jgi:hypothetical protein
MASDARALAQGEGAVANRRRLLTLDNRYLPPLLITSILLGAHLSFGILEAWYATALSIVTAIGAELVMGRITYGKWPHPASAYISGISAGILVRSNLLWPYFLTSLISITSKYVLRVKGRHLWNPTNFGVSAAAFLAPATITVLSIQWGNNVAPMAIIWMLGSVIVWRVGRAHISATYVASFLLLLVRRAVRSPGALAGDGRADHRSDVSAVHLLHGDRSEDDRPLEGRAVRRRLPDRIRGDGARLNEVLYAPFYASSSSGQSRCSSISGSSRVSERDKSSSRPSGCCHAERSIVARAQLQPVCSRFV